MCSTGAGHDLWYTLCLMVADGGGDLLRRCIICQQGMFGSLVKRPVAGASSLVSWIVPTTQTAHMTVTACQLFFGGGALPQARTGALCIPRLPCRCAYLQHV
jgi:hypothetical protein